MGEPEPWLRGPLDGVPAHVMPVMFSFQQVREDLVWFTSGVEYEQLWRQVVGKHSLGYHLKHMAGSVDRLTTYLVGEQLTHAQLAYLLQEDTADSGLADLLALINAQLDASQQQVLAIKQEALNESRFVGRQRLPTSVMGLLVRLCEHTQRHLGQAILIATLMRRE